MSANTETTDNVVINVPSIPEITAKRNNIELVYKQGELKKGDNKGWKYPTIEVKEDNLSSVIGYMGVDKILGKINTILRQLCQGWWEEALNDAYDKSTGLVDMDKAIALFQKLATDFSSRGESIPDLKARMEELVDKMTELDPESETWASDFKAMSEEIKDIKKSIEDKRRTRKTSEDKE